MKIFTPCPTDTYLSYDAIADWCTAAAEAHPDWVTLEELAETPDGRPMLLLTIGAKAVGGGKMADAAQGPDDRPGFWLDGGTHASEWTSVMASLDAASRWIVALADGDEALQAWFSRNTAYVLPCICPDGYQAMLDGSPFIRSTLRPPSIGTVRHGMSPGDIDGDGVVRWMRWRDPAGPFVSDGSPIGIRRRTLDDDPSEAYFVCTEGEFVEWDGVRWTAAPLEHGLDLNRNFPSGWTPFSMFGMDSGAYPLSAIQSRATVEAVAARPYIAAALTNHTYTGGILTQPYRADGPISMADQDMMEALCKDAVQGTDYAVFRVHPDFTYDPKQVIVGVWADTLATTFGIPGFTLELWNPFKFCGLERPKLTDFFKRPDSELTSKMLAHYATIEGAVTPWAPFTHPQLGEIEIGGFDYMRTLRNPPESLLKAELDQAFTVADRLRRSLPSVDAQLVCTQKATGVTCVELVLSNAGYLSTSGLAHGETVKACPAVSARLVLEGEQVLLEGSEAVALTHFDGWAAMHGSGAGHPIYPSLPARGHRVFARWWVRGSGPIEVTYVAGRGGEGSVSAEL
ncbi:MAG: hypothetical protein ACI9U2_001944 [Bradymonadia bacterium]|jgi:hypothetical protein